MIEDPKVDDLPVRDDILRNPPLTTHKDPLKPIEEDSKPPQLNIQFNLSDRWNQFVMWFKKSAQPIINNVVTTAIKAIVPSLVGWAIGGAIIIAIIILIIKLLA